MRRQQLAPSRRSSARISTPMAPCATAGSISLGRRSATVMRSARPSRFRPAQRQQRRIGDAVARACAAASRRCRAAARPRGRAAACSTCACRRSDEVPTTAPARQLGERRGLAADEGVAHVLARQQAARSSGPPAARVGMSFIECTARSISPASSASSISLVNRPLPPTSASGRSWMRSPVVLMTRDLERDAGRGRAPPPGAARTSCACASASGEPRVPMRIVDACKGRSPDARRCRDISAPRRLCLPSRAPMQTQPAWHRTTDSAQATPQRRARRSCSASRRAATRPRRPWSRARPTAAAASCPTSCARSGSSTAAMAAWCRRSPRARTSNASTRSSPQAHARGRRRLRRPRRRRRDRRARA